jgi:hypothetical protein
MAETETPTQEAFLDNIPPEYHSAISGFNDKAGLAKGYSELYSKMGSYVKPVTDESTPEEISTFYNKQGRPETPEAYTLPDLAEGKEYDKDLLGGMRTAAHETGLTDKQFTKLIQRYLDIEKQRAELTEGEVNRAAQESDRLLKEKWGAEYPANVELARRARDELIDDKELLEQFADMVETKYPGLGNDPVFVQVFTGIGQKMLDDTLIKGVGQVKDDEDYKPQYSNPGSAGMYAAGDDEESKKARQWHRTHSGYDYGRSD